MTYLTMHLILSKLIEYFVRRAVFSSYSAVPSVFVILGITLRELQWQLNMQRCGTL